MLRGWWIKLARATPYVRNCCAITSRPQSGNSGNAHVFVHQETPPFFLTIERFNGRAWLHASRPNESRRGERRAVSQLNDRTIISGDTLAFNYFDFSLRQLLFGVASQLLA